MSVINKNAANQKTFSAFCCDSGGSALLQILSRSKAEEIIEELLALPSDELADVAVDKHGSGILESLIVLQSNKGSIMKAKLVDKVITLMPSKLCQSTGDKQMSFFKFLLKKCDRDQVKALIENNCNNYITNERIFLEVAIAARAFSIEMSDRKMEDRLRNILFSSKDDDHQCSASSLGITSSERAYYIDILQRLTSHSEHGSHHNSIRIDQKNQPQEVASNETVSTSASSEQGSPQKKSIHLLEQEDIATMPSASLKKILGEAVEAQQRDLVKRILLAAASKEDCSMPLDLLQRAREVITTHEKQKLSV